MDRSSGQFNCIAVDMGASSIRVMLGTVGPLGVTQKEVHRMANATMAVRGHDRWDMELIIREIFKGIGLALELSATAPQSIGIDSWGVDFALMDQSGKLVDLPVAYRDKRTEGMQEKWRSLMPDLETFSRTGINFYIFNTLFQLLSLKDSDELKGTSRILFLPGYLNYILTGISVNELTISSTSQLLGLEGEIWDQEILRRLHLDQEILGKVIQPGTRLGRVHLPDRGEIELEGVAVCGHDTACVVTALPVEGPDYVYISAGTWCIVGIESAVPLISEEAFRSGFTNERGYGNSFRVLKNIVGLWLLQGLKKHLPHGATFEEMERMAMDGGETLQLIDPENPVFYNPADMREAFNTFFNKTNQPVPGKFSDYIRCAYHSLCFSFRYHIEKLEYLSGRKFGTIHMVGGGSQSEYLNQHIASICNRRLDAGPVEGAAIGNILIQAIAMGRLTSLEEGRALIRRSCPVKRFSPGKVSDLILKQYKTFLNLKT